MSPRAVRWGLRAVALGLALSAVAVAQGVPFGPSAAHQGSKGGTFGPASVSGLWAWYDGSTFATDGSTKDGSNNVTKWINKEGTTARDLTGVGATPRYTAAAANGLDAIDFESGDSDALYRDVTPPSLPITAYVVVVPESFNSGTDTRTFFNLCVGANNNDVYHRLSFNGAVGTPRAVSDQSGSSPSGAAATANASTATVHLVRGKWLSTTSREVELDGANAGTDSTSVSPSGLDRVAVGSRGDSGTQAGDELVCEVLIYAADVGSTDNASIESYLDAKWAIPGLSAAPPFWGPRGPAPWLLLGAAAALALLSLRRSHLRGQVIRPAWGAPAAERRAA